MVAAWHSTESISHPQIRDLAAYWAGKRGGRRAPSRCDIDPQDLVACLPHLYMLDVVETNGREPYRRFRVRLAGTEIVTMVGEDHTGRFLDETLPPDRHAAVHQELEDVVSHFVLRYRVHDLSCLDRSYAQYHGLMLPLSDDQQRVNIVLGIGYMTRSMHAPLVPVTPLQASIQMLPARAGVAS